jgi:uncharacterized protein YrzB (UPF0473 family)
MDDNIIVLKGDNNDDIKVRVIEQTVVCNTNYLLVEDLNDNEDLSCFILKDTSDLNDENANYSILDNDDEFDKIAEIFKNILEKDDIELK